MILGQCSTINHKNFIQESEHLPSNNQSQESHDMYTKIIELTTDKSTNIKVPLDTSFK